MKDLFSPKIFYPKLKKDLKRINNLKIIFREMRDYFAGNSTGITRDETIAKNLMRVLFCKLYDEIETADDEPVKFICRKDESPYEAFESLNKLFILVKKKYSEIFNEDENFDFNVSDTPFIMRPLQGYQLLNAERDVIADAFEELIGTTFRGGNGQFFTPRNIVEMMASVLAPKKNEKVLDPACGSGGFLAHVVKKAKKGAEPLIFGIDKDAFLSELAKIYLSLLGGVKGDIFCENSLDNPVNWHYLTQKKIQKDSFDVILTNPPFGAKIPIIGEALLEQYELGHIWKKDKKGTWQIGKNILRDKQPPQILFIERIVQFLKKGGRAGIVLPDGIFGNPSDSYIWEYLKKNISITAIISLSQETFQPSTHTKTSILFLEKKKEQRENIFMAVAEHVGHDKNGKEIYKNDHVLNKIIDDDLPEIAYNFKLFLDGKYEGNSKLGFVVKFSDIENNIYIPEAYWKKTNIQNTFHEEDIEEFSINDLLNNGIISIKRGNEIGSRNYGTGDIPFVRTTDIVNWEIKENPVKSVSQAVYEKYKAIQDIQPNDILFVNDGTFLIGRSALVSSSDTKIVIQSHLKKIRVLKNDKGITPYYLFYLMNTPYVQKQINSKIFTQATLSTLGNRLLDIKLPVLKDKNKIKEISSDIEEIMRMKETVRKKMTKLFE